ncbi:MAG: hypothetical protein ABI844_19680 [Saprospiraceae bacterium]
MQRIEINNPLPFLFIIFYMIIGQLHAQTSTNKFEKNIILHFKDSLIIKDSFYIIPESVRIPESHTIQFVVRGKSLFLYSNTDTTCTLIYKTLALNPDISISVFDSNPDILQLEALSMNYKYNPKPIAPASKIIEQDGVEYAGAFGRGLSFGNNQNLVLNSTLNMQLSGKIGDDIEINAAISDENLPIQADGNTQELNELDKVYIELKRKNNSLIAGDMQISPDETYFLKYFKKYKGIQVLNQENLGVDRSLETRLQGSVARGNFKRQLISVQEGNQGPYRMTGANNELFIIVLSGSEKVYLDGQLLVRGLENDYVMDYNRSEISFTAKQVLNRNSRIVVEFEYSNQSYLKSALALQSKYQSKSWTIQWNSYQEQDNKTSNILQTLTATDRATLAEAGDNFKNLLQSTIAPVTKEENQIQYIIKDTIVNNTRYTSILVLNQRNTNESFTARFNFVGPGNGDYLIEKDLFTNGRAYKWVAPDPMTGQKKGEYAPFTTLIAPKKQVQHNLKFEYHPKAPFYSKTELGLSNVDLNQFSQKDKQDDLGLAWKQTIGSNFNLGKFKWRNELNAEQQATNFTLFEPFRNPEFNRDWALGNELSKNGQDVLLQLKSSLENEQIKAAYSFQNYAKQRTYKGQIHAWQLAYKNNGTAISFTGNNLQNDLRKIHGNFFRPKLDLSQSIGKKKLHHAGLSYARETNIQSEAGLHLLLPQSFSFSLYQAYLQGVVSENKFSYQLEYQRRQDEKINGLDFTHFYHSTQVSILNQWHINNSTNWTFRLTKRRLSFDQINNEARDKNSNTIIWRQSFDTRSKNDAFRFNQTLEGGTGQEPAIEYTYIKVNKGQGYYTWIDINKDSIIQVSEFVPASYSDQGEYIRYAVTGNDFVYSKNYTFLQDFEFNALKFWNGQSRKKWYHRLSWISNINYTWKSNASTGFAFPTSIVNSNLIALQGQVRNQFYINRGGKQLELQIGQSLSNNKWRLSTGFEFRSMKELYIRSRHRINAKFSLENYIGKQTSTNNTEFFKEKNFNQSNFVLEPLINFQTRQFLRLSAAYKFKSGKETINNIKTQIHEGRLECTAQPDLKWSFRASGSLVYAGFKGNVTNWTEYNILQGLRSGKNILLQLNVDRVINANTILRLGYNGRKSEGSRFIQSGNAQILASF